MTRREASQLLGLRRESKGGAMFLFERIGAKGKNREPGLQEKAVMLFTGRRWLFARWRNRFNFVNM